MKTMEITEPQTAAIQPENVITFPVGLLGYEAIKQYVLLSYPDEAPFMWLQMLEEPNQGFVVVSPVGLVPGYLPDLNQDDVDFLGLDASDDAILLNIVTLRRDGQATVNLKGPIILNRRTLKGKQVIPLNSHHYSLQHPLPRS
jgi:flagellar assembly factor FliW